MSNAIEYAEEDIAVGFVKVMKKSGSEESILQVTLNSVEGIVSIGPWSLNMIQCLILNRLISEALDRFVCDQTLFNEDDL